MYHIGTKFVLIRMNLNLKVDVNIVRGVKSEWVHSDIEKRSRKNIFTNTPSSCILKLACQ